MIEVEVKVSVKDTNLIEEQLLQRGFLKGDFLELEIIVAEEIEKAAALDKIISILQKLGYEQEEIIRTSYLSMLQNKSK